MAVQCYSCPPGQMLACPACKHDVHLHSVSACCSACVDAWIPGKSRLADICIYAPPFIGSQRPVIVALDKSCPGTLPTINGCVPDDKQEKPQWTPAWPCFNRPDGGPHSHDPQGRCILGEQA